MKFRGYKLFYENRDSAESMVRQIDEFPSFFTPRGDRPRIIDCGANIGVSVLEWKTRWPGSRIVCFEPDPFAFAVLKKNVDANDIPDVKCIHAAVSDHDGQAILYGDIEKGGDARGNSIDAAWGNRDDSGKVNVACTRLSRYVADQEIDFLKLDIEGAEQRVLTEVADHLHRIAAIYVEVHETRDGLDTNSSESIKQLLVNANFSVETETRYHEHALPGHLARWQQRVGARQSHWLAWR